MSQLPPETMAERLRRLRVQKGWSLRRAAKEIGVVFSALDKWEKGENLTIRDPAVRYRMAKAYGTDMEYILWGESREPDGSSPRR